MANVCEVCESPSATTLHFGGRTCKACAAFFRRTVSMDMRYSCPNGSAGGSVLVQCRIHYELRMVCRQCRFSKCLRAGMKREMVQHRGRLSPKERREKNQPSPTESSQSSLQSPVDYGVPSTSNEPSPHSDSFFRPPSIDIDEQSDWRTLDHLLQMEASLNNRRRIMYTDTRIIQVFSNRCDCPYVRGDLREFNYKTFTAYNRHDFVMMYDYSKSLPGFDDVTIIDQSILYRFCCAVDCMINSAYYTTRLGKEESLLVLFNGEYIPMDPLPFSGDEEWAAEKFEDGEDHIKYKSLMPTKLNQWLHMAVPFCELDITFEEFCLLKVLTIWHMSYYKLSLVGKSLYAQQRDAIIRAMHRFCLERGLDPAERIGSLILVMSTVSEQVHELTNSLWMISFFDIFKWDSMVEKVLDMEKVQNFQ